MRFLRCLSLPLALPLLGTVHAGLPTVATDTREASGAAESQPSFLDPVDDFARNSILHPAAPFELIPGKDPNGWGFVLEPYAWAIGLDGMIGIKGLPAASFSSSALDVLKQLDWGFFARGEIRKGRWGVLADGYYAALSASGSLENRIYDTANFGVQQSIVSLAIAYRVIDDRRGFLDLYGGARYNFLGSQVDASINSSRVNQIAAGATDILARRLDAQVDARVQKVVAEVTERFSRVSSKVDRPSSGGGGRMDEDLRRELDRELREELRRRQDTRELDRDLLQALRQDRDFRELDRSADLNQKISAGSKEIRDAIRDYVEASAQARLAAARGAVDSRLEAQVEKTKSKLEQAIAADVEQAVPTHGAANQWWVDPIIGLRGQVNLTRWMFLAAQGDVGGFGAGSQIAWNTQASLGFNITRNVFAELGYRYMYVDYSNSGFLYQMNSFGLFTGMGVKF